MSYSFDEKRSEVVKALAELRRRLKNRRATGRRPAHMEHRCRVLQSVIEDYENAIRRNDARAATQEPAEEVQTGPSAQYLLGLWNERGRLYGPGNGNSDGGE